MNGLKTTPQPVKQKVQQQFGDHAHEYVTSDTLAQGYSLERLVALISPQTTWHVLDVATGGGHTALAFAPYVQAVVASDLTLPMLKAACSHLQGYPNIVFVQADAEQLPFEDHSFDLLTCRIAAHHFPNIKQFVNECVRVVRSGGVIAIVDLITPSDKKTARYINAFEKLRDPSHVWSYSLNEWTDFLETAGLKITHQESFQQPQNLTVWASRMGCTPLVLEQLKVMMIQAPRSVQNWVAPQLPMPGSGEAIWFQIQQAIILATKD